MTSNELKRAISLAVFGLGMLGGLWGCVASAGGIFTLGNNDTYQEILAITLAFLTPFPVCIMALWKRLIAGIWLIFAGCYFTYGMMVERAYMINTLHLQGEPSVYKTMQYCLPISLILIGIGSFGVITERLKWPRLLGGRTTSSEASETP